LCHACVELLEVDGAAISVTHQGSSQGTFGSSGELSRRLDEFQFTFGEGPCIDSVRTGLPVLVPDLGDPRERRWPAYAGAVLEVGVRAVYALPTAFSSSPIGALDLYRRTPGPLSADALVGGLVAAELAALPLIEMLSKDMDWAAVADGSNTVLAPLDRVEVYQATGMIMAQLGVGPDEALLRLRASAFAQGRTASEVAWAVVERKLSFTEGDLGHDPDPS
jgi:hypothetical protein